MKTSNSVKEAAATRRQIRGVHLTFAAPAIIEVLAAVDIQFVYIDGEHGCFDWRDIEMGCIAAERHDLTPIARIPDTSQATITRSRKRVIVACDVSGMRAIGVKSWRSAAMQPISMSRQSKQPCSPSM